jgi:hypothetical protein
MRVDCVLASPRIAQADPGRRTPPRGGSIIVGIRASLMQQTKCLKITTTLCWSGSLSPYKDYSSLLR